MSYTGVYDWCLPFREMKLILKRLQTVGCCLFCLSVYSSQMCFRRQTIVLQLFLYVFCCCSAGNCGCVVRWFSCLSDDHLLWRLLPTKVRLH